MRELVSASMGLQYLMIRAKNMTKVLMPMCIKTNVRTNNVPGGQNHSGSANAIPRADWQALIIAD